MSTYGDSGGKTDSVDLRTAVTAHFGALPASGQQHGGHDGSAGVLDPFLAARALIAQLDPPTAW